MNRPIIVIDDDEDDLFLINGIFTSLTVENEIITFNGGFKFLEYIKKTDLKPFFILCDINMGSFSGLELKKIIFDDEELSLKCIPFLFWSTSKISLDVLKAYRYNAQGYFIKPVGIEKLKDMLVSIIHYWNYSQHPNTG